ncbi:MAG: hypothetical protein IT349_21545 [Candidatus Eisenbacteria bacterium]|nr:hypothetical protein [Candidatus Eisenbacteria bacterium]MCC7144694.1 hypothetical protein [Candidatus Eisenbacteria bacterium]
MSRIDGPKVGPSGQDPVLYQDVEQVAGLKAALDAKTPGAEPPVSTGPRLLRELLWGRPLDPGLLVSPPPLPESMTNRPSGKDLVSLLRGAVETAEVPTSEAERRMVSTLKGLVDAQEGVLLRLSKLTKA